MVKICPEIINFLGVFLPRKNKILPRKIICSNVSVRAKFWARVTARIEIKVQAGSRHVWARVSGKGFRQGFRQGFVQRLGSGMGLAKGSGNGSGRVSSLHFTVMNIQIQTRRMSRFNEGEKAKEERRKYQKAAQVLTLFIVSYVAQWLPWIVYCIWSFETPPPTVMVSSM